MGGGKREHVHVEFDVAYTTQLLKVKIKDMAVDTVHVGAGELSGRQLMVLR